MARGPRCGKGAWRLDGDNSFILNALESSRPVAALAGSVGALYKAQIVQPSVAELRQVNQLL